MELGSGLTAERASSKARHATRRDRVAAKCTHSLPEADATRRYFEYPSAMATTRP